MQYCHAHKLSHALYVARRMKQRLDIVGETIAFHKATRHTDLHTSIVELGGAAKYKLEQLQSGEQRRLGCADAGVWIVGSERQCSTLAGL